MKKTLKKAQRLIVLRDLKEQGKIEGLSLPQIRDKYFPEHDPSTISRDLADIRVIERKLEELTESGGIQQS